MAITYGMSVKEFWEENPDLFWAYRFSYMEKIKMNQEIFNHNAWLQGAYFNEAVSVALNNAFSKEKIQYSDSPYGTKNENKEDVKLKNLTADLRGRIKQVQSIKNGKNEVIIGENRIGQ